MRLKRPEGLNIIPFIDIMLVLLTIVLTLSTFIAQRTLELNLPKATQSNTPSQKQAYTITLLGDQTILWQNEPLPLENLDQKLDMLNPQDTLMLQADEQSRFGLFVTLLDHLKARRLEHLDIAVLPR